MRKCEVENCERKYEGKGYCKTHHQRLMATGDPLRPCRTCGRDVVKLGDRTYCSDECRPHCRIEGCGNPVRGAHDVCNVHYRVIAQGGGTDPAYTWAKARKCVVCGAEGWASNGNRKYCSVACRQTFHRWRKAESARPQSVPCELCGVDISLQSRDESGRLKRYDVAFCDDCDWKTPGGRRYVRYGITPAQYASALAKGCPICKRVVGVLEIDHDHRCCGDQGRTCGQCVREPICGDCNRGLGLFRDDTESLANAIEYIKYHSGNR